MALVRARRAPAAPARGKSGKKPPQTRKTPTTPPLENGLRQGSKSAQVLDLLKRPNGATAKELTQATGWQPHSVRGFLSGTVGKNMGLAVSSSKGEDGERRYALKA
jgi:hypothetical protein